MSVTESLEKRRQEREALLERIVTRIREDKRVVAAWLTGSLGRGDSDGLSDIDLWIAVADNYARFVVGRQQEFVERVETPLLFKEAPQNAPPDGSYLLTLYPGAYGPHQVDWYWQPQSKAAIPADAMVLFNEGDIPAAPPLAVNEAQRAADLSDRVAFFWAMIAIAAKKAARRQLWEALRMIDMVQQTLDKVYRGLGKEPAVDALPTPPCTPLAQMGRLRALAAEMQALQSELVTLGGAPQEEAAMQVLAFFDLAEAILMASEGHGNSG